MQTHYHQQLPEQQQQQLKCPRCESTNTKFCYYNNYNLSQPRHFCKACRRYWTRGGNLRKVPVGGGTRKATTKRSASSSTSSPPPPTTVPSTQKVAKNEASSPAVSHPSLIVGHDGQFHNYNGSLSSLFLGSCDGTTESVLHGFKGDNINDKNYGKDVDVELNGMQTSESLVELQGSSGCWTSSDASGGSWPHHHAIFSSTTGSNFQ